MSIRRSVLRARSIVESIVYQVPFSPAGGDRVTRVNYSIQRTFFGSTRLIFQRHISENTCSAGRILVLDSAPRPWHDQWAGRNYKAYTDGKGTRAWKEFHAMIARVWRGIAAPETASNYLEHLQHTIFPELSEITGYQGASVLRRDSDAGVEFTVQTLWIRWTRLGNLPASRL